LEKALSSRNKKKVFGEIISKVNAEAEVAVPKSLAKALLKEFKDRHKLPGAEAAIGEFEKTALGI
jgi:hypothetical protein